MTGYPRQPSRNFLQLKRSHPSLLIDQVRPDDQLLRFLMNHPIGYSASHAFRADDLPQIRRDLVKFVRRSVGTVRSVGHHPKPIRPRYHGTRPTLPLLVEHRQRRVDAGNFHRLLGATRQTQ